MAGVEALLMGFAWLNLLIFGLGVLVLAAAIFSFVFWILMLVDCAQRSFKNETDKVVWILILVFLHALGAVIYYFAVKKKA